VVITTDTANWPPFPAAEPRFACRGFPGFGGLGTVGGNDAVERTLMK
jgi:hypothetical protein